MCLVIIVLLYNSLVLSLNKPCLSGREEITIKKIYASAVPRADTDPSRGILDLRVKLDSEIPCGIYKVSTHYGPATVIASKNNNGFAYLNFNTTTKEKLAVDRFEMWGVRRATSLESDFISTFNSGCCN
jgi:hypothetical protein